MTNATINQLGDSIAELTLIEASQLSEYLREVYGIEPITSSQPIQLPNEDMSVPETENSSFNVVLTAYNDKLSVIMLAEICGRDRGQQIEAAS